MGLFDKFKFKKKPERKLERKPGPPQHSAPKQPVVTPDGKLVNAPKKEGAKPKKAKAKKLDTGDAYRVLLRPLITEKGSMLGVNNQYAFEVAPSSNKVEVRKAIRKVYGIDPIKVNVLNVSGKQVRYGRAEGVTKHWKKAIVTLPEGQKIDIQEGL
ncbi:MAG: 50S ribosomal protein L23 [Patescibacteria group bacterium]